MSYQTDQGSSIVVCPVCEARVPTSFINAHLDLGCVSQKEDANVKSPEAHIHTTLTDSSTSSGKGHKRLRDADPAGATTGAKRFRSKNAVDAARPLADRVRPTGLDDFVGQLHLLAPGSLLRNLIDSDALGSMLLWGPPGTGKTSVFLLSAAFSSSRRVRTLARIIAHTTSAVFKELSATSSTTADVRKIFEESTNLLKLTGRKTILFVDEVQRFNKAQQDAFLPATESGSLTCIFATTENPSFRVNSALLSRCRVFVLNKLTAEDCFKVLQRARKLYSESTPSGHSILDDEMLRFLASAADGDARVALSSLELALSATESGKSMNREMLMTSLRKAHLQYDRTGDNHYDAISALHKSVRGSDANAALYWLARMLESGEDPLYVARRLVRMSVEDVGLADKSALPLALATYQSTQLIGMPECDCILAQCVVALAEAPKSVQVYKAYGRAKSLVNSEQAYPVPIHLRNAPTKLMKELGYGREYKYEPSYAHPIYQPFVPPELEGKCDFLTSEGDNDRIHDESLLRDWEIKHNNGRPWEGRSR